MADTGMASNAGRPGFHVVDILLPLCSIAVVALNRRDGGPFFLDVAPENLLRHGFRALLIPVFLLVAQGTGRIVLGKFFHDKSGAYPAGNALLAGFAAFTGLAFIIGALGWYSYPACFTVFAGLACISARLQRQEVGTLIARSAAAWARCSWPGHLRQIGVCAIALGAGGLVLLAKGIYPDYGGDIFFYFLYYQKALALGHFHPPVYDQLIYFPAKASGLHYFLAALCGLQALAYASYMYFVFLGVTMWGLFSRITKNPLYPCLSILVVATNIELLIFTDNFSKTNFYGAVLIYYLGYLACETLFSRHDPLARRRVLCATSLCCFQLAFFTIQSLLFAGALIGGVWLYDGLLNSRFRPALLAPILLLLLVTAALFVFSAMTTGYVDITTLRWQLSPANFKVPDALSIIKQFELLNPGQDWPDSTLSGYLRNVVELASSTGFLGSTFVSGWWAALIAAGFFAFRENGKATIATNWLAPLAGIFALYVLACSFIGPAYYRKHSMFLFGILFKITLYVGSFALLERYVINPCRQKDGGDRPAGQALGGVYIALLLLVIGGTALRAMPYNLRDDLRERVEYLVGKKSSNDVFMNYYPSLKLCSQTIAKISGLFLPLTDMTACIGYSGGRMLDLYAPALQPFVPALIEDNVQSALARLSQADIVTFPVDLTQEPTPLAFAPVFSPQSLEQNFAFESKFDDATVVLRVRKPNDSQLDAAFLDAWRVYLEKYNTHRNHGVYKRFVAWLRQSSF